jgi:hypothetical protein
MSDVLVIPSAVVETLKRKAKKLVKERGVAHHAALDMVARAAGTFPDWHHLIDAAKATEPAERAFKTGFVVGIHRKEMEHVPASPRPFVQDDRLATFVHFDFEKRHPKPWTDDVAVDWIELGDLVFFRSAEPVPGTLDAAWELCSSVFIFPPRYVRLRGKLKSFLPEDDHV